MEETSTKAAFTELDHDLLGDWLEGQDHLHDICGNYSLNIEQLTAWATRPDVDVFVETPWTDEVNDILCALSESETYYAKLFLKHQDKEMAIDCRPSDAIALALRFEVPILVSEGILELRG